MTPTFPAVYEDGVLKPLRKVDFKDHQIVVVNARPRRSLEAIEAFKGILKVDLTPEEDDAIARASLLDEVDADG